MTKCLIYDDPVTGVTAVVHPAYFDEARPKDETEAELLSRVALKAIPAGISYLEVEAIQIPTERNFRDAWECPTGVIEVNMPKARLIHMDRIRRVRDIELERESGSKLRQPTESEALFTSERQARLRALRDIPQTFDLAGYTTPEALEAAWPVEIPRLSA